MWVGVSVTAPKLSARASRRSWRPPGSG